MSPSAIPPAPGEGESPINSAHPDDAGDGIPEGADPADFFGDNESVEEERSLMPEDGLAEEPAGEAAEEPAGGAETEPPAEEPRAEAPAPERDAEPAPAAAEEEPAVADPPPAPTGGAETAQNAGDRPPVPSSGEPPLPGQQFNDGAGQREVGRDGAAKPSPAAGEAEPAAEEGPRTGPRAYVVVREIQLTKEFLEFFAKQLEEGKDPHTVYTILEPRVSARNPTPVLTAAFKKHKKRLGEPLRLAAIPLTAWKVKTLSTKPKVIDDNIEIED